MMKRQRVKIPWDLYWENKTNKLTRSIGVITYKILKVLETKVGYLNQAK